MGTSSWVEVEASVELELQELDENQRLGFLRVPMESKTEKKNKNPLNLYCLCVSDGSDRQ